MQVGKILFKNPNFKNKSSILSITSTGFSKVKVELSSAIKANTLTQDPILTINNLKAYIPNYLMFKFGVVRNVHPSISEKEITEEICSEVKVLSAKRLKRKFRNDGNTEWKDSYSVCLKFEGQVLPKYIYLLGMRCEVNIYVPKVMLCFKCLRYGHSSKNCKSATSRCNICAGSHNQEQCDNKNQIKCIHCKEAHKASYQGCEVYKKMVHIKKAMITNNLTFTEAKSTYEHQTRYASALTKNLFVIPNEKKHFVFSQVPKPKSPTLRTQDSQPARPPKDMFYPAINSHTNPIVNPYRSDFQPDYFKSCIKQIVNTIIMQISQKSSEDKDWLVNLRDNDVLDNIIRDSVNNYCLTIPSTSK